MMRTYWCSSCNIKLYDDKYNEPIIDKSLDKNNNGYSDNDNNSLDRLFNIENSE